MRMNTEQVNEMLKDDARVEKNYKKAIEEAETKQLKQEYMVSFSNYYLNNKKILHFEKIVRKLISQFPDDYIGYHLLFSGYIRQKKYENALKLLKDIKEKFEEELLYLNDFLEYCLITEDIQILKEFLLNDDNFMKYIPEKTLYVEGVILMVQNDWEKAIERIYILADQYKNVNALSTIMLLAFAQKRYRISKNIAYKIICDSKTEAASLPYFWAVYCLIFSSYFDDSKKIMEKDRVWMKNGIEFCKKWMALYNMDDAALEATFSKLIG